MIEVSLISKDEKQNVQPVHIVTRAVKSASETTARMVHDGAGSSSQKECH